MDIRLIFIVFIFFIIWTTVKSQNCDTCKFEKCEHPGKCLAGYVKDLCGCCWICGQREGELCYEDRFYLSYGNTYAQCGNNLKCQLDNGDNRLAKCVCKYQDLICASDGKTYTNLCHMMEESNRKATTIKVLYKSSCDAAGIKPKKDIVPCGSCDLDKCPTPENCLAGIVKDSCGCCMVCGRKEGELCESDYLTLPYKNKHGYCGDNLECKVRTDIPSKGPLEAICFCKFKEVICSTENETFTNICKLMEASYHIKSKIKVQHRGPCRAVPWIVSPPDDSTNQTGESVAFSCEVMGFPVPIVDWRFGTDDSNIYMLPGDEQRIAVQSRGGPEQYEVTSWLQIQALTQKDDGIYTCIAKNEMGEIRSSARLVVLPSE